MSDTMSGQGGGAATERVLVAAAQYEPRPDDVRWNISQALDLAARAGVLGVDLVVLPELGTTGYYMFDRFKDMAEPLDGPTIALLSELARRYDFNIVAGIAEKGWNGRVYDSAVLVGPTGLSGVYRKVHLWDKEQLVFTSGRDPPAMDAGGVLGRVGVLICYDLEFPETADLVRQWGARLMAAPAAFANLTLWGSTLQARARELVMPIVAANRVGLELDTRFCGHSMVLDASGRVLADAGTSTGLAMAELELPAGTNTNGSARRQDLRYINPEVG